MAVWIAHMEVTLSPTRILRRVGFEAVLLKMAPARVHVSNLENHSSPIRRWTPFLEIEDWKFCADDA